MKVTDIANVIAPEASQKTTGIRPGEKLHEQMISVEDSYTTYDYDEYFKILPSINISNSNDNRIKDGKLVKEGFLIQVMAILNGWRKKN